MNKEEVRFQVALSCIQGVLEAKHGIIGEVVPAVAVAESLRIADEFVKQWFKEDDKEAKKESREKTCNFCHFAEYSGTPDVVVCTEEHHQEGKDKFQCYCHTCEYFKED